MDLLIMGFMVLGLLALLYSADPKEKFKRDFKRRNKDAL